eukprot:11120909-Heterocapsa_arctica.AAC.1
MAGPTENSRTGPSGCSACWPSCTKSSRRSIGGLPNWSTAWSPCSPKGGRKIPETGAPSFCSPWSTGSGPAFGRPP